MAEENTKVTTAENKGKEVVAGWKAKRDAFVEKHPKLIKAGKVIGLMAAGAALVIGADKAAEAISDRIDGGDDSYDDPDVIDSTAEEVSD